MVERDKDGHFIMINGSTLQGDTAAVSIYAPHSIAPKYIKQILMEHYSQYVYLTKDSYPEYIKNAYQ